MTIPSIRDVLDSVSVDRIREHIQELEGIRHPIADSEALDRAAAYVYTSLQSLGYEMSEHSFKEGDREFQNIIATCSGTRYPEERLIVLAHYDTVSTTPGADDNASGVAVLLELATVLKAIQFDRSLQFIAVNLEEADQEGDEDSIITRGSRALAEHARENSWNIVGVVVMEMVAYAGGSILQKAPREFPIQVPEFGNFIGIAGNQASEELVGAFTDAVERYGIPLPYVPFIVPDNGETLPDSRRSDHAPFWDNGYRAIMLTDTAEFRNPHYHRASDTLETLNLPFAANVCRAIGGLVADVAGYSDET